MTNVSRDHSPLIGKRICVTDFVADAMRETILVEGNTPVDIGIINAGGLRDDLCPVRDPARGGEGLGLLPEAEF